MITREIPYPLNEFRPFGLADGRYLETYVYGEATITFRDADDWMVSAIGIDARLPGPKNWKNELEQIDRFHPLWEPTCLTLMTRDAHLVQADIITDLKADGVKIADPADEHRLTAGDYGLRRRA